MLCCGIFVSKENPMLDATPDGLLFDDDRSFSVVEVKCPCSVCNQFISSLTVQFLVNEGDGSDKLKLKENHDYYYQLQGQLLCTGAKKPYFAVYTLQDMKFFTVKRNYVFILSMFPELLDFYNNHFRKALLELNLYQIFYRHTAVESSK